MKILLINSVCGIGSTGRICTDLAQEYASLGHEVKIAYGRDAYVPEKYRKYAVRIGDTEAGKTYTFGVSACVNGKWTSITKKDQISIAAK